MKNVIDIDTGKPTNELVTRDIQVNDWTLTKINEESEPRIFDLELAKRLGFTQERDIRKLIKRMSDAKQLEGICATVAQNTGKRGRPAEAYYLTRAQALKVIARSETPIADKILDEVIAVYVAYQQGQLPPIVSPQPTAPSLSFEQVEQIVSMTVAATMKAVAPLLQSQPPQPQLSPAEPEPVYDFPTYQKPAPSGAPALQRELLEGERFRWYFAWRLQQQWDIDNEEFWRRFRQAGGNRRTHQRKAAKGYQIREDIVDKMLVDLNHQRR